MHLLVLAINLLVLLAGVALFIVARIRKNRRLARGQEMGNNVLELIAIGVFVAGAINLARTINP